MNVITVKVQDPSEKKPVVAQPALPVEPKLSDAELDARRQQIADSMWPNNRRPAPAPTATPLAASPVVETPAVAATPAAAAPAAPAPAESAPQPNTQEIINQTARAVATEIAKGMPKVEPQAQPEPPAQQNVTPEDAAELEIFARMEELKTVPAGFAGRMRAFMLSVYPYQSAWEAKNQDRVFNPEDDEHEEFFKNQPDYAQSDYDAAKLDIEVDRRMEKKFAERVKPELDQLKQEREQKVKQQAMAEAAPAIEAQLHARTLSLFNKVNSDYVRHISPDGKRVDFSEESAKRFQEAQPFASDVLQPMVMEQLLPVIVELERSAVPKAEYQIVPSVAGYIQSLVAKYEAQMSKKPESERNRNGRTWITLAERNQAIDRIEREKISDDAKAAKMKQFDDGHIYATIDEIEDFAVESFATEARAKIEKFVRLSEKEHSRGGNGAPRTAATTTATPVGQPAVQPKPANGLPQRERAPSVDSASEVVDATRPPGGGPKSFGETARLVMFGK